MSTSMPEAEAEIEIETEPPSFDDNDGGVSDPEGSATGDNDDDNKENDEDCNSRATDNRSLQTDGREHRHGSGGGSATATATATESPSLSRSNPPSNTENEKISEKPHTIDDHDRDNDNDNGNKNDKDHHSLPNPEVLSGDGSREESDETAENNYYFNNNDYNNTGCEYSSKLVSVDSLPPLPEPMDTRRSETSMGICTVITACLLSVLSTHYFALTLILPSNQSTATDAATNYENKTTNSFDGVVDVDVEDDDETATSVVVFLALVYTEAALALSFLVGVLCIDPCVVHRSQETCNPVPLKVESWLHSYGGGGSQTQTQTPNDGTVAPHPTSTLTSQQPQRRRQEQLDPYFQGPDRKVYCTKCLVWRRTGKWFAHCAICQRCVAYHDHHCNVLGRCIAGNLGHDRKWGTYGNIGCFFGLLATGGLAFFTVFAAWLYAASVRFGAGRGIPIGIAAMLLVLCCCGGGSNGYAMRVLGWPFRFCAQNARRLVAR